MVNILLKKTYNYHMIGFKNESNGNQVKRLKQKLPLISSTYRTFEGLKKFWKVLLPTTLQPVNKSAK